jgi:phosphate transport system protein
MPHIVKSFDEELDRLRDHVLGMSTLAEALFDQAMRALVKGDGALAKRVIEQEPEIDRFEQAVNDQVVRVLALRAPMADDLRLVVSALKVAGNLERIADYSANIARHALSLGSLRPLRSSRLVKHIGTAVHRQLALVLEAYRSRDAEKALAVWNADEGIDDLHSGLFRELLTYMMEDSQNIGPSSHLVFIAKNVERVGDHATNIAEMVYFLISGRTIEGERPKGGRMGALGE